MPGRLEAKEAGREHRDEGERDDERAEKGEAHHVRHLPEHDPRHAADEHDGEEHDDGRERARHDRGPDLGGAGERAPDVVGPGFPMAIDVLENDDRVVHEHADAEREPAEGDDVQREAAEIHEPEGGDDRDRYRGRDDERARDVAQKQEQDEDREQPPDENRGPHVADRFLDIDGGVDDGDQVELRDVAVDAAHFGAHAFGDGDGVGARLLADRDAQPRLPVDADHLADLLPGILDVRHVPDADRSAGAGRDDRVADLVEIAVFPLRAHEDFEVSLVVEPGRDVSILVPQGAEHRVGRYPERLELIAAKIDVYLPVQAAADVDRGHPGHPLEPVFHLVLDDAPQIEGIEIAGSADEHDRKGRKIEFPDHRARDVFRKPAEHAVDAVADVVRRHVEVRSPREGDSHLALPLRGRRRDLLHALHRRERLLDRPGDRFFHLLRADVAVVRDHGDGGEGDFRHEIDRQAAEGNDAEDDHDEEYDGRENRSMDGPLRDVHVPDFSFAPSAGPGASPDEPFGSSTGLPSSRRCWPSVTTRPSRAGERISVISGVAMPVVTGI